ncbi:BTB/POZ domain-containing protein 6-A [Parasteatoda tepidariorum]|uniref:BTB/POZ domain-containing protein 6-A n=1 Tax=Parasteatoda tepidariorum TaxID=114398 RepID=UPI001C722E1E|nr:BTB/POZ domain-containing protein 6-A [Parasteatoda tepidariorum]
MPPSHKRAKIDDEESCITNDKPSTSKGNNEDWREKAESFKERHRHAMKQGILTDVSFAVGPQGTPLYAHKMILALASPVFEAMFYGSLKETGETIGIPDIMPSGFQLLLDYIYTDNMEFENETDALYAWFAADKYCLSHMRDICCNYLTHCTLTSDNVWIILENSVFLNSKPLAEKCLIYLKTNIAGAMCSASFLDITGETLKKILSMDSLYIKEIELLKGIVWWAKEKLKNGSEEPPLQQFLEPYLSQIRFGCISQGDFVDFIDVHHNIITDSDALAVLKYMTDNRTYSLPNWCSHNVYPRRACEKRQGSLKMTLNIRSYAAIKPQPSSRPNEQSGNQSSHNSRNERIPVHPRNVSGPSRRREEDNDSHYYSSSLSEDDDDDGSVSRRAVAASNVDSDDTSSSYSSSSSSTAQSFSS